MGKRGRQKRRNKRKGPTQQQPAAAVPQQQQSQDAESEDAESEVQELSAGGDGPNVEQQNEQEKEPAEQEHEAPITLSLPPPEEIGAIAFDENNQAYQDLIAMARNVDDPAQLLVRLNKLKEIVDMQRQLVEEAEREIVNEHLLGDGRSEDEPPASDAEELDSESKDTESEEDEGEEEDEAESTKIGDESDEEEQTQQSTSSESVKNGTANDEEATEVDKTRGEASSQEPEPVQKSTPTEVSSFRRRGPNDKSVQVDSAACPVPSEDSFLKRGPNDKSIQVSSSALKPHVKLDKKQAGEKDPDDTDCDERGAIDEDSSDEEALEKLPVQQKAALSAPATSESTNRKQEEERQKQPMDKEPMVQSETVQLQKLLTYEPPPKTKQTKKRKKEAGKKPRVNRAKPVVSTVLSTESFDEREQKSRLPQLVSKEVEPEGGGERSLHDDKDAQSKPEGTQQSAETSKKNKDALNKQEVLEKTREEKVTIKQLCDAPAGTAAVDLLRDLAAVGKGLPVSKGKDAQQKKANPDGCRDVDQLINEYLADVERMNAEQGLTGQDNGPVAPEAMMISASQALAVAKKHVKMTRSEKKKALKEFKKIAKETNQRLLASKAKAVGNADLDAGNVGVAVLDIPEPSKDMPGKLRKLDPEELVATSNAVDEKPKSQVGTEQALPTGQKPTEAKLEDVNQVKLQKKTGEPDRDQGKQPQAAATKLPANLELLIRGGRISIKETMAELCNAQTTSPYLLPGTYDVDPPSLRSSGTASSTSLAVRLPPGLAASFEKPGPLCLPKPADSKDFKEKGATEQGSSLLAENKNGGIGAEQMTAAEEAEMKAAYEAGLKEFGEEDAEYQKSDGDDDVGDTPVFTTSDPQVMQFIKQATEIPPPLPPDCPKCGVSGYCTNNCFPSATPGVISTVIRADQQYVHPIQMRDSVRRAEAKLEYTADAILAASGNPQPWANIPNFLPPARPMPTNQLNAQAPADDQHGTGLMANLDQPPSYEESQAAAMAEKIAREQKKKAGSKKRSKKSKDGKKLTDKKDKGSVADGLIKEALKKAFELSGKQELVIASSDAHGMADAVQINFEGKVAQGSQQKLGPAGDERGISKHMCMSIPSLKAICLPECLCGDVLVKFPPLRKAVINLCTTLQPVHHFTRRLMQVAVEKRAATWRRDLFKESMKNSLVYTARPFPAAWCLARMVEMSYDGDLAHLPFPGEPDERAEQPMREDVSLSFGLNTPAQLEAAAQASSQCPLCAETVCRIGKRNHEAIVGLQSSIIRDMKENLYHVASPKNVYEKAGAFFKLNKEEFDKEQVEFEKRGHMEYLELPGGDFHFKERIKAYVTNQEVLNNLWQKESERLYLIFHQCIGLAEIYAKAHAMLLAELVDDSETNKFKEDGLRLHLALEGLQSYHSCVNDLMIVKGQLEIVEGALSTIQADTEGVIQYLFEDEKRLEANLALKDLLTSCIDLRNDGVPLPKSLADAVGAKNGGKNGFDARLKIVDDLVQQQYDKLKTSYCRLAHLYRKIINISYYVNYYASEVAEIRETGALPPVMSKEELLTVFEDRLGKSRPTMIKEIIQKPGYDVFLRTPSAVWEFVAKGKEDERLKKQFMVSIAGSMSGASQDGEKKPVPWTMGRRAFHSRARVPVCDVM